MSAETSVSWWLNVFKMNISCVSISREDPRGCEVDGVGGATPWWVMTCEMEMNILYQLKWRGFITAIRIKSSSLAAVGLVLNMQEEHLFSLKINGAGTQQLLHMSLGPFFDLYKKFLGIAWNSRTHEVHLIPVLMWRL